ncbi:TonB-system energizer ExbB [Helicobacter heilmannii]|uniref:TonB-system energizer ExbB n=1 Tax=Helicobacter heilmannii TaxID=35817 RepID=UPI0006A1EA24|nr:TonB-system energizer ExbB [Helicobacter heilmannii]CRF46544.1 Ferric siderophore transport system, biopolymer transport protein ExbB [Helicobacter heilmannii]CRF47960.1 Ferric siderophore transport system, biopolymer transport protein ExbB [Helicobacter heilmannii]CRF48889.1 Ferric siderophore transport system, biopolymer transport protein ExbB [Helicobacter heilmannii]CRF50265.1 Ferric siderophore transport system, biopolymer transport protein ExbB [Helicobacter heilmannii]GMB94062.1 Biop
MISGLSVKLIGEYVDIGIFMALGVMSFVAMWFTIERIIFYSRLDFSLYDDPDKLDLDLSKNLTTLYIVYSNAPYVGLLGTVLGVMVTFYDMSTSSTGLDAKAITLGLSLALKATAFGLVVAIPTLVVYNAMLRKSDVLSEKFRLSLKKSA